MYATDGVDATGKAVGDEMDISSPDNLEDVFKASTAETASQSLQSIIQFHFQKTVEKKKAIDAQKKELWRLLSYFFIFLSVVFVGVANNTRLECRHSWGPIGLCVLGHLVVYVAVAQTLRCLNGLKFQRHCHKLTLGVAAAKYNRLRSLPSSVATVAYQEFEVPYQEPGAGYCAKFKRRWLCYTVFLLVTLSSMVASFATILCF